MQQIDLVYQNYADASRVVVNSIEQRKLVQGKPESVAEVQIRVVLPELFKAAIANDGRELDDYRVYGNVGQPNRNFVKIPWVVALRRDITIYTTRGYYVVLLFREDMQGCALSLNQGYTDFKDTFGTDEVAVKKIRESAAVALTYLDLAPHFVKGPIDLGASRDLGIGYEQGAIASAVYAAGTDVTEAQFLEDFRELLRAYDTLCHRLGKSIVETVSPANEDDFQEAATELSSASGEPEYEPPPPGPVPRPPKSKREVGGYKRNPRVSGAAIRSSTYECEVDASHVSFTARKSKKNFVEAHHLIAMQFQERFLASLDVLENIVVLCPTCHRKLHHGQIADKKAVVAPLHAKRLEALKSRGIGISEKDLIALYRAQLEGE